MLFEHNWSVWIESSQVSLRSVKINHKLMIMILFFYLITRFWFLGQHHWWQLHSFPRKQDFVLLHYLSLWQKHQSLYWSKRSISYIIFIPKSINWWMMCDQKLIIIKSWIVRTVRKRVFYCFCSEGYMKQIFNSMHEFPLEYQSGCWISDANPVDKAVKGTKRYMQISRRL